MLKYGLGILLILSTTFVCGLDLDAYQPSWNQLIQQPQSLQAFLNGMPKGADLHLHVSGAVTTEKLVSLAKNQHYCMDKNFHLSLPLDGKCSHAYFTDHFLQSPYNRQKTIQAWSMQNFHHQGGEDGKEHFFETFDKFGVLTSKNWPEIIADVVDKAHDHHVQYLELMLSMHGSRPSIGFSAQHHTIGDVLKNPACHQYIQENVKYFRGLKKEVQSHTPWLGEDVDVSWILEIRRNQTFDHFWVDAVMVFAIANRVHDIVAVNMVQPEYMGYAKTDYLKQMQFLNLLSRYYPNVKLVLHAGEVPPQLAKTDVRDHMKIAIDYLKPKRIGHGTDVLFENDAEKILASMEKKNIAVEINLTSNDQILGIKGGQHPLKNYLQAQVPVVISSDDPGVSRNNLSHEYYRAVTEQKLALNEVIQANRNSLTYSLLKGQSLWENPKLAMPVKACKVLNSVSCLRYVSQNSKAYHQWLLEQELDHYFTQLIKN